MTSTESRITPGDLGTIPRTVAVVICELVNRYGVRYRMQNNGGHIFLYNGDTQSRPYKISASRPSETTMDFLEKWIRKNVPEFFEKRKREEVTPADVAALAGKVNTEPKPVKAVPPPPKEVEPVDVATPDPSEWEPFKYGFVTNGTIFRCVYEGCDYTREDARGLHLHEAVHTGKKTEYARMGGNARAAVRASEKVSAFDALTTLAAYHRMEVVPRGTNVDKLLAENERLKQEVEDLKARVSLITEALHA